MCFVKYIMLPFAWHFEIPAIATIPFCSILSLSLSLSCYPHSIIGQSDGELFLFGGQHICYDEISYFCGLLELCYFVYIHVCKMSLAMHLI